VSNRRQSAKNGNADAYRDHEIKIDDDSNVITFLHEVCCYKNCQTILRQCSTENRGVNQSNQKKMKPSCLPASMTRNQLYAYTELAFLSKTKNNGPVSQTRSSEPAADQRTRQSRTSEPAEAASRPAGPVRVGSVSRKQTCGRQSRILSEPAEDQRARRQSRISLSEPAADQRARQSRTSEPADSETSRARQSRISEPGGSRPAGPSESDSDQRVTVGSRAAGPS
jgi:hypothetical protein